MTPHRLVCISLLLVLMMLAWVSGTSTSPSAAQTPASSATPGSAATPANPQQSSVYLAGDALPLLPAGKPDVVDVIAVGAPVRDWFVPVVLRNNTSETVVLSNIAGVAHDAAGELLGDGNMMTFIAPSVAPPGQVALAFVEFNSVDPIPGDATVTFAPTAEPLTAAQVYRQDLDIIEVLREDDQIVGLARNGTNESLIGSIAVLGLCFDTTGNIQGLYVDYANASDLGPGETAPFKGRFDGTGPCEAFLIGAGSYKRL